MPKRAAQSVPAVSFSFTDALALMSVGYNMRYSEWPEDDYCSVNFGSRSHRLTRYHSDIDFPPYDTLPWITADMVSGKWYFSRIQSRAT